MKKVWIFGDSISAEVNNSLSYQQAWSHFFKEHLNENIEYKNVAVGGTTLKWFNNCDAYRKGEIHKNIPEDSRWHKIIGEVEKGDFFIFFLTGANDHGQRDEDNYFECPNGDYILDDFYKLVRNRDVYVYVGEGYGTHRYYTARSSVEEFSATATDMIEQVKAKGAIPLIARGTGKYFKRNDNNFDVFLSNHNYVEMLPQIAQKTGAAYLDIGGNFETGFKELGYAEMMERYFMSETAIERLNKKFGKEIECKFDDNCHFNLEGAEHLCGIFIEELKKSDFPLKEYLK